MNGNSQREFNKEVTGNSKSQEVQNQVHLFKKYPELLAIVSFWPGLPEHIKTAIKMLVETARK